MLFVDSMLPFLLYAAEVQDLSRYVTKSWHMTCNVNRMKIFFTSGTN